MKTFLFPGQGSQSRRMGESLFDEFENLTNIADKILGYSIKELCLDDPRKELNQTQFTQPALYVVNALSYFKKIEQTGQKPDFVAGHSLGEFNALLASECFDFEAGLKLVKKRGELMSQATDGGMAAILNASKEKIESIIEKNELKNIDMANYNTPSQIVISGLKDEIKKAQSFFQEGEILYYPLNTSGAFHSRFMEPSKEKFYTYLKKFRFSKLKIPVISNVTAEPYQDHQVIANLSAQITSSVKWSESIQYLMGRGDMEFEEIGHGEVLTKLVYKIKEETPKILRKDVHDKEIEEPSQEQEIEMDPQDAVEVSSNEQDGAKQPQEEDQNIKEVISDHIQDEKMESHPDEVSKNEETKPVTAEEKVNAWNKNYPIGIRVDSSLIDDKNLETRTEAVVLFGHRAAVYMKDYNGYFDLDEITPK